MFSSVAEDASGPSYLTRPCIPPAWKCATQVHATQTLVSSVHRAERMRKRWDRRLGSRRIRMATCGARAPLLADQNPSPHFEAPHHDHHEHPISKPLTSTLDTQLTNKPTERFIVGKSEGILISSDGCFRVPFPSKSPKHDLSQVKPCSGFQVLPCTSPRAEPTRVSDEVPERPRSLVFGVFEEEQDNSLFHDVSTDMVILNPPHRPAVTDPSSVLAFGCLSTSHTRDLSHYNNCPSEGDLLRFLQSNKRNLVLHSSDSPHIPHIVITPPEFTYESHWAYVQNGVEWQCGANLWVPPRVEGYGTIVVPQPYHRHSAWKAARIDLSARASCPWRIEPSALPLLTGRVLDSLSVFSPSNFQVEIEAASRERLLMYHVIPALYRKLYKVVAIEASRTAAGFRRNWDSPGYAQKVEKPFIWTDPAEPLLTYHHRQTRSLILDSTQPFSIPHIIIEEAELQDPEEAFVNCVPCPQDYAFGQLLVVPFQSVTFKNVRRPGEYLQYDEFFCGMPYVEEILDEAVPELCPDSYESSSGSESPPSPPMLLDTITCDGVPLSEEMTMDSPQFIDDLSLAEGPFRIFDEPEPLHNPYYGIEDDEDDLPPFDDWYVSIAKRAET